MIDPIENDKINELARNAVSGDADSFRELVFEVTPRIERFLHRQGASPEDAEDVAQEVWLRVTKALGRYDPRRGFLTWVFTITKNAWIDCIRKGKQLPASTKLSEQPLGNPEQTSVDALEQLFHCLDGLCEEYRTIIRLRYGSEGLSLEQVAQRLGESYGSVRAKCQRAVNQLLDCVGVTKRT
jgi:RNA polymerase sigma-70 factor (ECF subfamily)